MSAQVTLEDVTLSYGRHPAVHHVSGCFAGGSLTAVAGPNGAGKSTLLKAIAGLVKPDGGRITLTGAPRIAYLPQAAELMRDFPMPVAQLVAGGFWHRAGWFGGITPPMKEQVGAALAAVGLRDFEKRALASLSAGQFQRALFARLLLQDAPLILLDEPFTAIDASTTEALLTLIHHWHREGRTTICVLHDFEMIRTHFPECLLLARDCIAWEKSASALKPERLLNARFFREAWGAEAQVCERAS